MCGIRLGLDWQPIPEVGEQLACRNITHISFAFLQVGSKRIVMKLSNGRLLGTKQANMHAPCLGVVTTRWPGLMYGRPHRTLPLRKWNMRVSAEKSATQPEAGPVYLSDLIPFEVGPLKLLCGCE